MNIYHDVTSSLGKINWFDFWNKCSTSIKDINPFIDSNEATSRLRAACMGIVSDREFLRKPDGKCLCAVAVKVIADHMECHEFCDYMTASDIISFLKYHPNWYQGSGESAHKYSHRGRLAVAAQEINKSSHLAVIYPYPHMHQSKDWDMDVPYCANICKDNGVIAPVSNFFEKEPMYFLHRR